jgi:pimeloyl-ACP methyl ester carboxylesterase
MAVISELRLRTSRLTRWLNAVLALLFFAFLVITTVSAILYHGVVAPPKSANEINLQMLLGHPSAVSFPLPDGRDREGWFFPGLRRAPLVIVCHGYQSQRGDLLTLVTALQEHQFNVYIFDFSGHGTSPGRTTLGYRETGELLAAIDELSKRDDIDAGRFGLWGANLGGYAALAAAAANPRVRALAVDSVYDTPADFLRFQLNRSGLSELPQVEHICAGGFGLLNWGDRHTPPLSQRIGRLGGVAKLFISSQENPVLAKSSLQLFLLAPPPREQAVMSKGSYVDMTDDEKHNYENVVVSFFLRTLPPTHR